MPWGWRWSSHVITMAWISHGSPRCGQGDSCLAATGPGRKHGKTGRENMAGKHGDFTGFHGEQWEIDWLWLTLINWITDSRKSSKLRDSNWVWDRTGSSWVWTQWLEKNMLTGWCFKWCFLETPAIRSIHFKAQKIWNDWFLQIFFSNLDTVRFVGKTCSILVVASFHFWPLILTSWIFRSPKDWNFWTPGFHPEFGWQLRHRSCEWSVDPRSSWTVECWHSPLGRGFGCFSVGFPQLPIYSVGWVHDELWDCVGWCAFLVLRP